MKAMKFKVKDEKHSEEIQKKLFEMGYMWAGKQRIEHTLADSLYAGYFGGNEITYAYNDFEFESEGEHNCKEHFLTVGGEFVTADYFTQPATVTQLDPLDTLADMQQRFDSTKPPIGLKPRRVHDQARLVEIAEAIVRYAQAGKKVPEEWWGEAKYINEFMEA